MAGEDMIAPIPVDDSQDNDDIESAMSQITVNNDDNDDWRDSFERDYGAINSMEEIA
jgi:hypothetical protein